MKPILFSTEMIKALLAGRKTQTRRVIKDKDITNRFDIDVDGKAIAYIDQETGDSYPPACRAKYQPGDILWVRETWNYFCLNRNTMPNRFASHSNYCFKASENNSMVYGCCGEGGCKKWRPSIFMPREACRIFLKVKNVRVERAQEITEEDAKAEGMNAGICQNCGKNSYPEPCGCENPQPEYIGAFAYLWNIINKKRGYGWSKNPWVWVIEFERVEKP